MSCTADLTPRSNWAKPAATILSGTEASISLLNDMRPSGRAGPFLLPGAADLIFVFMKPMKWDRGFKAHGRLVLLLLALTLAACKPKSPESASEAGRPPPFSVTPPIPAGADDLFEDVTAKARIDFVQQFCDDRIANILESNGSGVVVFDYDNDGYMDLYFVNPGPLKGVTHEAPGTRREPNRLYHNNRDGTFTDVTEKAGVGGHGFGIAAAAGDYDGDGRMDLYVVNVGKNILYHNNGDGTFTDVTDKAGVGDTGTGIGATWLDVNNDGRLDLYVANYLNFDPDYKLFYNPTSYPGPLAYKPERDVLYINNGDGTFTNASESAGIWALEPHRTMSVCPVDFNRDGHVDLYLSNDATPNMLLINDGHGHFHDEAAKRGVAFNALGEAAGSMTAERVLETVTPELLAQHLPHEVLWACISAAGSSSMVTAR